MHHDHMHHHIQEGKMAHKYTEIGHLQDADAMLLLDLLSPSNIPSCPVAPGSFFFLSAVAFFLSLFFCDLDNVSPGRSCAAP